MTPITIDRAIVEQALEALEMSRRFVYADNRPQCDDAIDALRAALAQQAEPKGGGNLPPPWRCPQCNGPADNGHDRSIPPNPYLCTKCMAEMPQPSYNATVVDDAHPNGIPLEQWQNKPVEPVDVGLLEYRGNSVAFIHQKMTAYRTGIDAAWDAFRANGLHPDGKTSLADMIAKYTAPPQRKPLTEEEIGRICDAHWCLRQLARAIERAHGIIESEISGDKA